MVTKSLAPRLAKPLAEAIAAHGAYLARRAEGGGQNLANARFRAVSALLKELGLDRAAHPERVTAAELHGDRRTALAELTRHCISVRGAAELPDPWEMRRLVGLAPPGILEELGVGWGASYEAVTSALAKVPAARRVEAHIEAELASWGTLSIPVLEKLRADAPAALDYARATLPELPLDANPMVRVALFTAFSASGTTVPEGADERLSLAATRFVVEHLEAIAPTRRDVVLTDLLSRERTSGSLEAATLLVERVPGLPRATATLRRLFDRMQKQRMTPYEKKVLVQLDRRLRAVEKQGGGEVAAPRGESAAKKRALEVTARSSPRTARELSALAARQLVEAGRRFDGKALPAARRLSLDENDESAIGAVLEHVTISEGGRPAFEAWLHGDSGAFFRAGTCDVVATRGDAVTVLEGATEDDALEAALHRIGPSKQAVRPVTEVRRETKKAKVGAKRGKDKDKGNDKGKGKGKGK